MDACVLTIQRTHRGCVLLRDGTPLGWYPGPDQALAVAVLLAEARNLRDGTPAEVMLQHAAGRSQRLARFD